MGAIQAPFTDAGQSNSEATWSEAEDDALLRGVAGEQSWDKIAAEITDELATRTADACRLRFEHLKAAARGEAP
jgi:hypothetical protein